MMLRGESVIVTGGAGVIGRELIGRLAERGARVLSIDRVPSSVRSTGGTIYRTADIAAASLASIARRRPKTIFHLAAAFERSEESGEFWDPNWHDNVVASHRLLEAVRRIQSLETLVFASSYLVYSGHRYLHESPPVAATNLREDDELDPRNLCGAAKLYTEREMEFLRKTGANGPRFVAARIFRVYGRGSRDVISRWVRAIRRGTEIVVYQEDNRFDYIYAGDVAEGLVRMAEADAAEGAINLGTGKSHSVREVLQVLSALSPERRLRVRTAKPRGPYEASAADNRRLSRLLGWKPPTDLKEGIRLVWDYEGGRRGRQ